MKNRLSLSRVLVTGGGGFLGRRLCERLANEGAEVHAIGRTRPIFDGTQINTWQGDLADEQTARKLVANVQPDVMFHLASTVSGGRELDLVRPTFLNNLASTVNLLVCGTEAGCSRIVLTGSMEEPSPEDSSPLPGSPYAAAKWASATYARMFHALYGTPVIVLRVFMVYGPGQDDPGKVVPYVARSLLDGVRPKLSSGRRAIDWVYVDDVVGAFLKAGRTDDVVGKSIDIGSGKRATLRQVVELLVKLTGAKVEPFFGAFPDRPLETAPMASVQDAIRLLGWRAQTNLEEGLARTVEWVRTQSR